MKNIIFELLTAEYGNTTGNYFFPGKLLFFDILRDSGTETIDEILSERNHQVYQQRDGRIEK